MNLETFLNCLPWLVLFAVCFFIVIKYAIIELQTWWVLNERKRKETAEARRKVKEKKKEQKYWERIWMQNL